MPDYSKTRIQLRRGTAAELAAANPVLGVGEPAFSTDTNALKIGDGSTAYSSLSSISGGGGGGGISDLVEDTTPQLGGTLDTNSQSVTGGIRSDTVGIDLDSTQIGGTPLQVYDFADTQPFFAVRAGSAFISAIFGPSSASANNRIQYYSSNTTTGNYWRQDASQNTYSLTRVDGNSADATVFSITNSATTFAGNVGVTGIITGTSLVKSGGSSSEFLKADGTVDSNDYVPSDTTGISGATAITNIVSMSQASYDALGSYDASTIYYIV